LEENQLLLRKLETGDEIHRRQDSLILTFQDKRKVLSTSHLNGGYREDLMAVWNHNINSGLGLKEDITNSNYQQHMHLVATALGVDPEHSAGLLTAAHMENAAIHSQSYEDLTVTAVVTAGIDYNGGRAGDPASFHERRGEVVMLPQGTINILLYINADLSAETLARALVTCTEAKTAALQELMAGSCYSSGLATGSGTDGTILVANSCSELILFYAGKHSKLGELIGITVKAAVKEALFLETGLSPKSQFSLLKRWKRFGLNSESLWQQYQKSSAGHLERAEFDRRLAQLDQEENLIVHSSLYIHLMDQMSWGLISPQQAENAGKDILSAICTHLKLAGKNQFVFDNKPMEAMESIKPMDTMMNNYVRFLLHIIEQ